MLHCTFGSGLCWAQLGQQSCDPLVGDVVQASVLQQILGRLRGPVLSGEGGEAPAAEPLPVYELLDQRRQLFALQSATCLPVPEGVDQQLLEATVALGEPRSDRRGRLRW